MYKTVRFKSTGFNINTSVEGETLETKILRMTTNKEPVPQESELIFQDRSEGVSPGYNIRTDRFEVAIDAMTTVDKSYKARREENYKRDDSKPDRTIGQPEPTQGSGE